MGGLGWEEEEGNGNPMNELLLYYKGKWVGGTGTGVRKLQLFGTWVGWVGGWVGFLPGGSVRG